MRYALRNLHKFQRNEHKYIYAFDKRGRAFMIEMTLFQIWICLDLVAAKIA